jgi:hypothetical protein
MDIPQCALHIRGLANILRWLNPTTETGRLRYRLIKRRGEWRVIRLADGRSVIQHPSREWVLGTLERTERAASRAQARMARAIAEGRVSVKWPSEFDE